MYTGITIVSSCIVYLSLCYLRRVFVAVICSDTTGTRRFSPALLPSSRPSFFPSLIHLYFTLSIVSRPRVCLFDLPQLASLPEFSFLFFFHHEVPTTCSALAGWFRLFFHSVKRAPSQTSRYRDGFSSTNTPSQPQGAYCGPPTTQCLPKPTSVYPSNLEGHPNRRNRHPAR